MVQVSTESRMGNVFLPVVCDMGEQFSNFYIFANYLGILLKMTILIELIYQAARGSTFIAYILVISEVAKHVFEDSQ